ncbi:alpha-ketoacid dehydrogenase subunit beta [Candidatus Hecatella orcuttiae]|jgi:pyruvate/2-oxoglutarate/acetoin dehydrogenase E1 component|uniref:alpha-ketoacid dehydrogenase subunit beta n=1 Tax=Candidatus Hecatella orcuttiae TaxID=1935119 RepID=UPI002867FF09|nr:alpha-ketoacid dehydrogenase subunit beta [Candidatus Hecatella orcuttiae]
MRELTYSEALREALREEMLRDSRVILMGEDIGVYGGAYKVTQGLLEEFGPERVRDTPISESAIVGSAIGAALMGLRPVAEIMYMDFMTICSDQLVTQAAKMRFMSGGKLSVPMVVRTQYSLGRVHGSQHSQFFPVWFLNVPGLKVVLPSTPSDAKGLLKAAIRDEDPVLFVETGLLYRMKGPVPEGEHFVPLGKAEVKRRGNSLTVVAFSRAVHEALAAAQKLEEEGIEAEVIDPRSLRPLDLAAILDSVRRTGVLIIAEDDVKTGGIGAEIAASVMEEAFDYLDAPILRVASPDMPVPFSPSLEREYMPNSDKIVQAARKLLK